MRARIIGQGKNRIHGAISVAAGEAVQLLLRTAVESNCVRHCAA